MSKTKAKSMIDHGTVATNRKAGFNYFLEEKFEAGIELTGSEVKSLRQGKASITEAYVDTEGTNSLFLINATIEEYNGATLFQHKPNRTRRLLLHKKEIKKLIGSIQRKGYTLIPLNLFFNERGKAKLQIALATGKKLYDKRQTEKDREWSRDKARLLKN